jgi:zinc protease
VKKYLFLLAVAVSAFSATAEKPIPPHYSKIAFPEWSYAPPYPKDYRVELKDGAVAYLVPDSTLDVVKLSLLCARPSFATKPEDVSALRMYSNLLKDGGTEHYSPEQLEDSLEFIAASVSASLQGRQNQASFDALGKDADAMLGLIPEVVLKPRLDTAVFKVDQRNMLEGFKHRYDTPRGVIGTSYERVMHGSHPSNWIASEKEITALKPSDLKAFIGMGYTRKGLVLGVAGRFDRTAMIQKLNTLVDAFPVGDDAVTVPAYKGPSKPGVYIVDKPFSQATIRLGAMGVQRPSPDYYRLVVASYIFGDGGFTSRLMERVRSNEGLAYDIGSEVESDYYRTGTVYVGLQTKAVTGAYAVKLVIGEMRRMAKDGITDEELVKAKDGLLKSLPSLFDTPGSTARIFAQGEIWKRSPEHFIEYQNTLKAMTRKEVEEAFRKYFNPDSLRIVVAGPKNVLTQKDTEHNVSLSDFGSITELTAEDLDKRE